MIKHRSLRTAALVLAATLGGGLGLTASAASAVAAPTAPTAPAATPSTASATKAAATSRTYQGRVTASVLQIRYLPTTTGKPGGQLTRGQRVDIVCKVRGTAVNGNTVWYELLPTYSEFVSAAYVSNVGAAPRWCGRPDYLYAASATTALKTRVGPTLAEAVSGRRASGAAVDVVCKLRSDRVAGNDLWYFLTDGSWASAAYLRNVGTIPVFCR